jgi:methionyl-tRNA formyltransferase
MRIALVGAVESSRVALESLIEAGAPPVLVTTLPLAKLIRHSDGVDLRPTASAGEVPVFETTNVNSPEALATIESHRPDYVFVIGWSQICKAEFLAMGERGTIGFHPSLLPRNRGRAVIPWTILQQATETGTSLFWMDEGMDSGDLLLQERFPVDPTETARTLYDKHMARLRTMVEEAIDLLKTGKERHVPQDHSLATYCAQRIPEDGKIDWTRPAPEIWRLIRATTHPYPGAFSLMAGKKVIVWEAAPVEDDRFWGVPGQVQEMSDDGPLVMCGSGTLLALTRIQLTEESSESERALRRHARFDLR